MTSIESRIVALERSNRRLKFAAAGAFIVACFVGAGRATEFDSITVNKLWVKERCTVGDEFFEIGKGPLDRTAIDLITAPQEFSKDENPYAFLIVRDRGGNSITTTAGRNNRIPGISAITSIDGPNGFGIYNAQFIKK